MEQPTQCNYSLDYFPKELLIKIVGYCKEEERRALSLVSKKFYHIYREDVSARFVFHLQGHTLKLFNEGLAYLLRLQSVPFQFLKITGFNLKEAFGQWEFNGDSILGKPIQEYLNNSVACKRVLAIEITDCLVTDESLIWLRRLFPHFVSLALFRICFTRAKPTRLAKLDDLKIPARSLQYLKLSFPLVTDCNPSVTGWNDSMGDFASWLIDYCNYVEKITLFKSRVSANRVTKRSFYQMNLGSGWKSKAKEDFYDYTRDDFEGRITTKVGRYGNLKFIRRATMPIER